MQIGAVNNGLVNFNEIAKGTGSGMSATQQINAAAKPGTPSLKPHVVSFAENEQGKGTKLNILA
jgi:hypothetical protein